MDECDVVVEALRCLLLEEVNAFNIADLLELELLADEVRRVGLVLWRMAVATRKRASIHARDIEGHVHVHGVGRGCVRGHCRLRVCRLYA